MSYRAWFRCIDGHAGEYSLTDVIYRCPTCDGLLEVAHDLDELRKRSPKEWTDLFDSRYKRTLWPYGSGVWGKNCEAAKLAVQITPHTNTPTAHDLSRKRGVFVASSIVLSASWASSREMFIPTTPLRQSTL